MDTKSNTTLKRDSNQALGLGEYAINFLKNGNPSDKVIDRVKLFHTDSIFCGLSALAQKCNAPHVFQREALENQKEGPTKGFAKLLSRSEYCPVEKVIAANCSAVREWDSNGTVFGYREGVKGHMAGEFGHNDFYPVIIAAAHENPNIDGKLAVRAMILIDEIRGRLAEVFSLKSYKIDHVVHGAIAAAATYGALMGATAQQIESAIGMFVAHYIPFRAIRAGKQLSDSKGASAAISTEAAISCIRRSMNGFVGPKDIFRNPEAIWRLNEPTQGDQSPFDLILAHEGDDFAVMGMHFKIGLYEHQSAGAIEGIMRLLSQNKFLEHNNPDCIQKISIKAYEPAFGIIGDPAKRNPTTRQSADHSMVYIVARLLKRALSIEDFSKRDFKNFDEVWKLLMLYPKDYGYDGINDPATRKLMDKIEFIHGGPEYDEKYPDGIPTSVIITASNGKTYDSGMVMYPAGHARNAEADLSDILNHKFKLMATLGIKESNIEGLLSKLNKIDSLSNKELQTIYECELDFAEKSIDDN